MNYYFDITLSRQHKGTPHGLSRVEVSLAKDFLASGESVIPFWLNEKWEINQGSPEIILKISDGSNSKIAAFENFNSKALRISPNIQSGLLAHIKTLSEIRVRERLIVIATYSVSLLPRIMIPIAIQMGKRIYKFGSSIVHSSRIYRSTRKPTRRVNSIDSDSISIEREDIVVIAGNDWDRRTYERVKSTHPSKTNYAFVIYDLIPYEYSHYSVDIETASRFTYWIGDVAQRASYLFFISEYSKDRFNLMLEERSIESTAKQMVISLPPGIGPSGDASLPTFSKEIEETYILVVCTIEARKNHQILVSALRLANSKNEKFPQMVFIGSPGWGTETLVREICTDESLKNRIVHKSGISDNELRWLYENCTAVAYPSIVEGLGLPVFESAVFKKPVITSDIRVFDEIPHQLRTKVNPYDTEGWKVALQKAGSQTEPEGGWKDLTLPIWKNTVAKMIAFMSDEKSG